MTVALQNKDNQTRALHYLKRPRTVEFLANKLDLDGPKAARGLIDRLRLKGEKIKNVGSHTFHIRQRRNPRSS
jgi:hypothetical protein